MARHWFGGDIPSFVFDRGPSDEATLVGGSTITFHSAQTGGVQYVDLLVDEQAADHAVSVDTDPGFGSFGPLQGPDDVLLMWASADGGPRFAVLSWSVADLLTTLSSQVAGASSAITGHVGATNPHVTRVRDLADANSAAVAAATDGQVLTYHAASGLWIVSSIEGVSGVVTITGAQTVTGAKTHTPAVGTVGLVTQAPAGQTADQFRALNSAGQRSFWLDNRGQPRVTADAIDQVAFRVEQRSSGQTADLTRWTAVNNGSVLAWVDAIGRMRGPNVMYAPWIMGVSGVDVVVGDGLTRIYNDTGTTLTIRAARASAGVAPVGDDIIIDIERNAAASILTAPLVIADSTNTSGKVTSFAITTLADGDYLNFNLDQIGDSTAGDFITVQLVIY